MALVGPSVATTSRPFSFGKCGIKPQNRLRHAQRTVLYRLGIFNPLPGSGLFHAEYLSVSDGRRQTVLTQLGIPISGLAIHPVVKMASFRLSFEGSHTLAGQVPAEWVQLSWISRIKTRRGGGDHISLCL
jgi:hypothetical protein